MAAKKIYSNKGLFILYGMANLFLLMFLLTLLILYLNDIYIINRIGFVVFVGVHLVLLFFIKIHYLCIFYYDEEQKVEFHYSKQFGWKWQQKMKTVLLPLKQFDGYDISMNSMGVMVASFYKHEQKERYELGPFYIGFIPEKEKQFLTKTFGEPSELGA
jgi:hypothetical protein